MNEQDRARDVAEILIDKIDKLKAKNKKWKELSSWQDKLLVAYRMGTSPSEKCLNRIYELKKALKGE